MEENLLSPHRLCFNHVITDSATASIAGLSHLSSVDTGLWGCSVPEEEANAK